MKSKSVYNDSSINNTIIVLVLSGLMLAVSLYLTQHFFDVKFPTGLSSASMCNINSFFNCDKATNSPMAAPFNIPISIFGAIMAMLMFMGIIFKNEDFERTIYFALIVNFVGCVLLFLYSLIGLHGLCPFCTVYYVLSGISLFFFYKKSENFQPNIGYLVSFALVGIVSALLMRSNINDKIAERDRARDSIGSGLITQFYNEKNLGQPSYPSVFKLATAQDAPIKMVIFSDFECPACKALSEEIPMIVEKYKGKIDIAYYFYPLDMSCNTSMKRPLHQHACKAAYAAACMPVSEFYQVHEVLFKNQEQFESGFVDKYIKDNKLESCVEKAETKDKVAQLLAAAAPFNISSTPTFLLNGVKIEGVIPFDQLSIILDEILKRAGK